VPQQGQIRRPALHRTAPSGHCGLGVRESVRDSYAMGHARSRQVLEQAEAGAKRMQRQSSKRDGRLQRIRRSLTQCPGCTRQVGANDGAPRHAECLSDIPPAARPQHSIPCAETILANPDLLESRSSTRVTTENRTALATHPAPLRACLRAYDLRVSQWPQSRHGGQQRRHPGRSLMMICRLRRIGFRGDAKPTQTIRRLRSSRSCPGPEDIQSAAFAVGFEPKVQRVAGALSADGQ